MPFANLWDIAAEHITTFLLGVGVGFLVSDRYRLVRRNGNGHDAE